MSRFIDDSLVKIKLSETEYIEVLSELSIEQLDIIQQTSEVSDIQKSIELLAAVVKGWNLVNAKGEAIEPTKNNIKKLNIATITQVLEFIGDLYNIDKKK